MASVRVDRDTEAALIGEIIIAPASTVGVLAACGALFETLPATKAHALIT